MSLAEDALKFASIFEGELLTQLMLIQWKLPFSDDEEFRSQLLESAAEVLQASVDGEILIEDLPPESMNLVAALWYAEWRHVEDAQGQQAADINDRSTWLDNIRHALPSCFCNPDLLQ